MHVTPLVVLATALLLVSGLVKLRGAERVGLGLPVLPLVEVGTGVALLAVTVVRPLGPGWGLGAVVASVVLVLGSSIQVGIAMRRRRHARELSEGARLRAYIQYLSPSVEPEEPLPASGEDDPA